MILGPLLISVVARTLGWALLFGGNSGLVNKALMSLGLISAPLPFMFTETGVVVALTHVLMPFMVLAVWAALQRLDPQVENAAVSLGAGRFTVLRRIVLPQVMPGMLSGAIIVFALAASAFATPAIIGGRRLKVASTLAYDEFLNTLNWPLGAAVAVLLLVALVAIVVGCQPPGRAPLRARCSDEPQRAGRRSLFHTLFVDLHAGADRGRLLRRLHARGLSLVPDRTAGRCAGSRPSPAIPSSSRAFWRSLWLGALSLGASPSRSRCRRRWPSPAIASAAARP